MFKLPVCPHCGTVYRYKDIVNIYKERFGMTKAEDPHCYHCQKQFKPSLIPGIFVLIPIWLLLNIGTLLLMLSRMTSLNIVLLFIITLLYIALTVVLIPFFVTFKKIEKKSKK